MHILFVGDIHGSIDTWNHIVFPEARDMHADVIVQLGDFGYFEHLNPGVAYLDVLEDLIAQYQIPVYFIDGNHDNIPLLNTAYDIDEDGFRPIRQDLFHIPRGQTWEWDGIKFLGLGGAYSIDSGWRIQKQGGPEAGQLWWPEEMITDEQVELAKEAGKVDIMLTHDAPKGINMRKIWRHIGAGRNFQEIGRSGENRLNVKLAMNAAEPKWLIHGHYHILYDMRHFPNWGPSDQEMRITGLPHEMHDIDMMMLVDTAAIDREYEGGEYL